MPAVAASPRTNAPIKECVFKATSFSWQNPQCNSSCARTGRSVLLLVVELIRLVRLNDAFTSFFDVVLGFRAGGAVAHHALPARLPGISPFIPLPPATPP